MNKQKLIQKIIDETTEIADFTNGLLQDDDIINISEALKNNTVLKQLIIKNSTKKKNIYKYNFNSIVSDINNIKKIPDYNIRLYYSNFYNKLTEKGFNTLFNSLKYNNTLTSLSITNFSKSINSLAEMLNVNTSIQHLRLNINLSSFINETFKKLMKIIKNRGNLLSFSFHSYNITEEQELLLFEAIKNNKNLTKLTIKNFKIFNHTELINLIDSLNNLEYLNISRNFLNDEQLNSLFDILQNNITLEFLNVKNNCIKDTTKLSNMLLNNVSIKWEKYNRYHR